MNRLLSFFLLLSVLLPGSVFAQEDLQKMKSGVKEKVNGKEYYIHLVKKGQSLYMLSKAYNVDINEIILENPELKDGLKAGHKIRIPAGGRDELQKKQGRSHGEEKKGVQSDSSGKEEPLPCGMDKSSKKSVYSVALVLPLYLEEVAQLEVDNTAGHAESENRPLQFIQFYEGFRMALDSLQRNGISLKVYVYDVERDTVKAKKLLNEPEMKNIDLIIGLMYPRIFQIFSEFAGKNHIPIINPLTERDQVINGNPFVFKVRPSTKKQIPALLGYLGLACRDSNIIVISGTRNPDKSTANNLMTALVDSSFDAHLAEGYGEAISLLSKRKGNVILLISEDRSYILDVVTKLNEQRNDFRITLFGLPRWDRLDYIEADYLVNLKTHIMAPYFIDYEDTAVKRFVKRFQDQYKTDPEPLAFQGFDVPYYFITALWKYGRSFSRCLPELKMNSLQTDYRFSSTKGNGFENLYWNMYEYDNYRLRRVVLH